MVGEDFVDSPLDIYIECVLGCFLSLVGVLVSPLRTECLGILDPA